MTADIKQNADDIDAIEKELEDLATSESLGALEVRVKANEDAVATVDTRISTAVSAAEGRVDTKLAHYAKTADVNAELAKKADQSAMETALGNKADKSELSNYQTVAGMTTVLAPYAKTEDMTTELNKKADATALADYYKKSESYSQTEVDNKLSAKANAADVYTKAQMDEELGKLATSENVYTKDEVYTKAQVDDMFAWEVIQ